MQRAESLDVKCSRYGEEFESFVILIVKVHAALPSAALAYTKLTCRSCVDVGNASEYVALPVFGSKLSRAIAAGGEINPVTVLGSGSVTRIMLTDDDGSTFFITKLTLRLAADAWAVVAPNAAASANAASASAVVVRFMDCSPVSAPVSGQDGGRSCGGYFIANVTLKSPFALSGTDGVAVHVT